MQTNSKYEEIITKEILEKEMYQEKLSQRKISEKYNVGKGTIQFLQNKYKLQILNLQQRRVPRSLTDAQKQIVMGTVISDGHLFKKNEIRNAALSIKHSIKQEELLDYKYENLIDFIRTKPSLQVSKINEKTYVCKSFRTLSHDYFTYLHNNLYKKIDGRYVKFLNKDILDKLEPLGLCVAYMDDGTVHHSCRDFCYECFSYDEQKMFSQWLKDKYDLKARVIKYGDKYRTRIYSWEKFDNIIRPFILEKFKYKIKN